MTATYNHIGNTFNWGANLGSSEGDDLAGFVVPFSMRFDEVSILKKVSTTALTTSSQIMMEIAGSDCWTAATVTVSVATTVTTATVDGEDMHYNTAAAGEIVHFNIDEMYSTTTTHGEIMVSLTAVGI